MLLILNLSVSLLLPIVVQEYSTDKKHLSSDRLKMGGSIPPPMFIYEMHRIYCTFTTMRYFLGGFEEIHVKCVPE
jgi:hypothetical protein